MNNSYYQQGPPQPQGYYPQGPPQPAYGGQQPMYYQQGPPPMAQQQYAQPQNEARPAKAKKDRGCLTACLATLCCCFVCEEGCECCCDCCEDGCECCSDML